MPHELSRADARRIAVQAQLLGVERPTDLLDVVRHLMVLQAEPTNAIAPSADLVLWSRLGAAYDVAALRDAIDEQRLIEHQGFIRPAEDLALFRAEMARWPGTGDLKDWTAEGETPRLETSELASWSVDPGPYTHCLRGPHRDREVSTRVTVSSGFTERQMA